MITVAVATLRIYFFRDNILNMFRRVGFWTKFCYTDMFETFMELFDFSQWTYVTKLCSERDFVREYIRSILLYTRSITCSRELWKVKRN